MESTGLSLVNDDNAIRVLVNGVEKFLAKDWLEGDGRAANTILSKQILGTLEGFQGTKSLTLEEELFPSFDLVLDWLSIGDEHIRSILSDENASQLSELAVYFGLDSLLNVIQQEKRQRDEAEAYRIEQQRIAAEAEARRVAEERERERYRRILEHTRQHQERMQRNADQMRSDAEQLRRSADQMHLKLDIMQRDAERRREMQESETQQHQQHQQQPPQQPPPPPQQPYASSDNQSVGPNESTRQQRNTNTSHSVSSRPADPSSMPVHPPQQHSQQQRESRDQDTPMIRHKQQRLLLLHHARICHHEANCPDTPHCAAMKRLWEHIANCTNTDCSVEHCMSSRYVLSHYRRCHDFRCPVCGPVREVIKQRNRRLFLDEMRQMQRNAQLVGEGLEEMQRQHVQFQDSVGTELSQQFIEGLDQMRRERLQFQDGVRTERIEGENRHRVGRTRQEREVRPANIQARTRSERVEHKRRLREQADTAGRENPNREEHENRSR